MEKHDTEFMAAFGAFLLERQEDAKNANKLTMQISDLNVDHLRRFFEAGWAAAALVQPKIAMGK